MNRNKASKTNKKTNAKKAWISNPQKTHAEIDAPESKYWKTHIQLKPEPIEKSKTNTPLNFRDERVLALISFQSDLHGERLFVSSEENVCSSSLPLKFKCSQNLCLNHVQIRTKVHSPYPCLKQVPDRILKIKD